MCLCAKRLARATFKILNAYLGVAVATHRLAILLCELARVEGRVALDTSEAELVVFATAWPNNLKRAGISYMRNRGYDGIHTCSAWYTALAHRGHSTRPPKTFEEATVGRLLAETCEAIRAGDTVLKCMAFPVGVEATDRCTPPVGVDKMALIGVLPVALGESGDSAPKAARRVGEGGPACSAAKPVLPLLIAVGERGAGKRDAAPDF